MDVVSVALNSVDIFPYPMKCVYIWKVIPLLIMSDEALLEKLDKIFVKAYILELIKQWRLFWSRPWSSMEEGSSYELLFLWGYLSFQKGQLKVRPSGTLDSLNVLGGQKFGHTKKWIWWTPLTERLYLGVKGESQTDSHRELQLSLV